MLIKRCPRPACGRPFQVNRFDAHWADMGQRGKMVCPHCGVPVEGEEEAVFLTHALSIAEESAFDAGAAPAVACR